MSQHKYLTFYIKNILYGIEILSVREIVGMQEITPLPDAAPEIQGVINLRGNIIPVIDMGLTLHKEPLSLTEKTCIIIVDAPDQKFIGFIVDSVSHVEILNDSQLEDVSQIQTNKHFIQNVGKSESHDILLLNIDQIISNTTQ